MDKPRVSISCITYNHEKYIRDCLDGFMMQRTNFPFEVLIHDDASTDHTADIIREYEAKYPDIVKPIYQTENRYSKGVHVDQVYNFSRARGKYIALCEGDDYWTDPEKLQRQFDFMESHSDYSMCCHNVILYDYAKNTKTKKHRFKSDQDLSLREVISRDGGFIATQSIFFRTEFLPTIVKYTENCPVGDYPLQIALAVQGRVFYDRRVMAVYRRHHPGSWTANRWDPAKFMVHVNRMYDWCCGLRSLDEHLPEDAFRFILGKYKLMKLWPSSDLSVLNADPECRCYMRRAHPAIRLYLFAQLHGWFKKKAVLHL